MGDKQKMEDLAKQAGKEKAKQKNKNKLSKTQQTFYTADQLEALLKKETIPGERKVDMRVIKLQTEQLKRSVREKTAQAKEMEKRLRQQEDRVKKLEQNKARRIRELEERINKYYKEIEDDRKLFEKETKANARRAATIKKLTDELRDLKSEVDKNEKIFNKLETYKKILSPPELQEAQQAEALKGQVPSHRDAQDEQSQPQESDIRQGLDSSPDGVLSSTMESTLSAGLNNTLDKNSKVDHDSSEYEEKLVLNTPNFQQPLDLAAELRDQCLSLMENAPRLDATVKELQETVDTTEKKIREEQEKVIALINDKMEARDQELAETAWLKKMVDLQESSKTDDEDILLDTLERKIDKIHASCTHSRSTDSSTLEKLTDIEHRVRSQLQLLESIPADRLKKLRQTKEKEKRDRLREEKLRLEEEKRRERTKKCSQRSFSDVKKNTGRKLMPRSFPMEKKKIQVRNEDDESLEDKLDAYYFGIFDDEDSE